MLIALAAVLFIIVGTGMLLHEPRPTSEPSPAGDSLALSMLEAIDATAWDSTRFVKWTFTDQHHYLWDKQENIVRVQFGATQVFLNTDTQQGVVFEEGEQLSGKERESALKLAWGYFCNDSFWLNAPAKVFDPGTERSVITTDDGRTGLLVHYASGGVTPGDSYLWFMDQNGLPTSYRMWVSIIPIGGLEASWEDWTELSTGANVAQMHRLLSIPIPVTDVEGSMTLSALGESTDALRLE